jgi:predicted dinucleotide-binding enzyme
MGATVAVLGMAYKPGTAVIEASQGLLLAEVLADDGYRVVIADPQGAAATAAILTDRVEVANGEDAVRRADVVVLTTPWPEFAAIPLDAFRRPRGRAVVIDPWRLFEKETIGAVADLVHLGAGGARTAFAGQATR